MVKKDYYTLKEIILGLSDEYQLHEQELQNLKKLCTMNEKQTLNFHFRVHQPECKNPILLCEYEPKQNLFQKSVTDNNEYYFLCGYRKYPIHVKHDYGAAEQFYHQANSILNSEFSNSIRSKYIEKNELGIDAALTIDTTQIELYIRKKCGSLPSSILWYDSSEEMMKFQSYEENLNKQYIDTVLNIGFPTGELNPYHIQKINSSEKREKPINLQYDGNENRIQLDVIEEEKQVVLCKRR